MISTLPGPLIRENFREDSQVFALLLPGVAPLCPRASISRDLGLLQCLLFPITDVIRFWSPAVYWFCLYVLLSYSTNQSLRRKINQKKKYRCFVLFVLLVLQPLIPEQLELSGKGKIAMTWDLLSLEFHIELFRMSFCFVFPFLSFLSRPLLSDNTSMHCLLRQSFVDQSQSWALFLSIIYFTFFWTIGHGRTPTNLGPTCINVESEVIVRGTISRSTKRIGSKALD